MEILSQYPKQVIVLKGTQDICGLSGRAAAREGPQSIGPTMVVAWLPLDQRPLSRSEFDIKLTSLRRKTDHD